MNSSKVLSTIGKSWTRTRRLLWRTMIVGLLLVYSIVGLRAVMSKMSYAEQYDLASSRRKLEAIGRALLIYREAHGVLPVPARVLPSDAALPPVLSRLAVPGFKWSLADELASFQVSAPSRSFMQSKVHFTQLYWDIGTRDEKIEDLGVVLRQRGEEFPVLADLNGLRMNDYIGQHMSKVLVLRLNGNVDLVDFDPRQKNDLWRK